MGLNINSDFSKVSFGAAASMKTYQGMMSKSLTRISTGKRYAAGGSVSAITASINQKKSAATYEAQYYTAQENIADFYKDITALETALEAAMQKEADAEGGVDTSALGSVISTIGGVIKGGDVSIGMGDGNLTISGISAIMGGTSITSTTAATTIGSVLASAYAGLTAADYASTFLQNMAGAAQAAYSSVTDTDIALEMSKYVKANVNSQAAQAMVAQANQSMASMLNLLQ